MAGQDFAGRTVAEIVQAFAGGKASARDIAEGVLDRCSRAEPFNPIATLDTAGARAPADAVLPATTTAPEYGLKVDMRPAGWPCDARIEELRDAFARATDIAQRKQITDEIQARAAQVGTHDPLGEWFGASAVSSRTKGWLRPPSSSVFWSVER